MSTCFLTYSDDRGASQVNRENQAYLCRQASKYCVHVYCLGPDDVDACFREKHRSIWQQDRGAGFWLWKPYLIHRFMRDYDYIVYVDSGTALLDNPFKLFQRHPNVDMVAFHANHNMVDFTKKSCMEHFDRFHQNRMIEANFLLIKTSMFSTEMVSEWLRLCTREDLLTDTNGEGPHRHDQSLFSFVVYDQMERNPDKIYIGSNMTKQWQYAVHHKRRSEQTPIKLWCTLANVKFQVAMIVIVSLFVIWSLFRLLMCVF